MCVCVYRWHICVYICRRIAHVWGGQRTTLGMHHPPFFCFRFLFFFRQGLSLTRSTLSRTRLNWLAKELLGSSCLHLPRARITNYVGSEDQTQDWCSQDQHFTSRALSSAPRVSTALCGNEDRAWKSKAPPTPNGRGQCQDEQDSRPGWPAQDNSKLWWQTNKVG